MPKPHTIPEQIRRARERAGLSQQALGEAIGLSGPGAQTLVSRLESGDREPNLRHLRGIADATGRAIVVVPAKSA